jgi:hypothetical protein
MIKSFFRKLFYYQDVKLLFSIFLDVSAVFLTAPKDRLRLAEIEKSSRSVCSREKLIKYLNFIFFALKKIGIRLSCYNSAVVACRALRSRGIDAKIVFGAMWEKQNLRGHCWIELEEPSASGMFLPIFQYPFESGRL